MSVCQSVALVIGSRTANVAGNVVFQRGDTVSSGEERRSCVPYRPLIAQTTILSPAPHPSSIPLFPPAGMVLCATSAEGKVEFVVPPEAAKAGERVAFAGHEGAAAADPKVMDKKKVRQPPSHLTVEGSAPARYRAAAASRSALTPPRARAPHLLPSQQVFDKVAPGLRVDEAGVATWEGIPFMTSAGPCTAVAAKGGLIK